MRNLLIIAIFLTVSAFSCGKDPAPAPVIIGGKGGNATLNVYPAHHGVSSNLTNMKIYIKYNSSNAGTYDDSANCNSNSGSPFATFSSLKKGNYYLYGAGFDTSVSEDVHGGKPYTITDETTQRVDLPVSEH